MVINRVESPILSIIVPAYNEEATILELKKRLDLLIDSLGMRVQVIFVDDHSRDTTPVILDGLCAENSCYNYIRLSTNSGSHLAILAGMAHATGDAVVFLAADLQDPPELIPQMIDAWLNGNHIVWAVRSEREGVGKANRFISVLARRIINKLGSVKLPPEGSDFALVDRQVVKALLASVRTNPSLMIEIVRLGFKQISMSYTKEARFAGKTKWGIGAKIKLFIDAIVTTSFVPIRLMSYAGFMASFLGFAYAVFLVTLRFTTEKPVEGWTALMVAILLLCGIQMLMLGILGEYLWRTLETSRNRPLYIIEKSSIRQDAEKNKEEAYDTIC